MSASSLGVPVFARHEDATAESVAGFFAQQSVFAGKVTWKLSLLDVVERFVFAEGKVAGFFVIDGNRLSICHRMDSGEGQEAAIYGLIDAAVSAGAGAHSRYTLTAMGGAPSCPWQLRRADGTLLNPAIVWPSVGGMNPFELAMSGAVQADHRQLTITALLNALDGAPRSGYWVVLASQIAQALTVWFSETELPDFTAAVIGHELLDASYGYRAKVQL